MVRLLLSGAVIGDYLHMVLETWLEGQLRPPFHGVRERNIHDSGVGDERWRAERKVADVSHRRGLTRARTGGGKDKILVLFARIFVLDKGFDVLVDAMTRVTYSRYAFLLIGSGGMESLIQSLRESGRVVIRQGAGDTEVVEYYAASNVLLLPSVKEGIELVLYEAMANGLLVITTDADGQEGLVTPDRGGLLKRGPTLEVSSKVVDVLLYIPKRAQYYARLRAGGARDKGEVHGAEICGMHVIRNEKRASNLEGGIGEL